MSKVVMLVGLPGSGKSNYSNDLATQGCTVLSSDSLRKELYGSEEHQDNNGEVFTELYRRAHYLLASNKNVVIDATNISSKRRKSFVKSFSRYELECHYINTPYSICKLRDNVRQRTVGSTVIDRMYHQLQIPIYAEGWNKIKLIHHRTEADLKTKKSHIEELILNNCSHKDLFVNVPWFTPFINIHNLPHDSKYHSLSVSRHTYYVWKYVFDNYHGEDKLQMLWAALLHDTGKAVVKNFKPESRYANFIGHENVSAQITIECLHNLGYADDFILHVAELVQLHMRLLSIENENAKWKLENYVGTALYKKLEFLRDADNYAH